MKRCGLYIRVSTDRQAKVAEGALKNQDQFLTQHVELKNKMNGEQWAIVERYVDEGKSAKKKRTGTDLTLKTRKNESNEVMLRG